MPSPQTDLLVGLTSEEAARVWDLGEPLLLSRGDLLFDLGASADSVFHVVRGCISLTLPMQIRGRQEDVLVEERMAGETVGWSGLIPPYRFTLKATARADSELRSFPRQTLLDHFAAHPRIAATVTRNIATVIGHRLQVFQAMWLREMQRSLDLHHS